MTGATTACHIHPLFCQVAPHALQRRHQRPVTCFGVKVSSARIEIKGTNGVTCNFIKFAERFVVLVVGRTADAFVSTNINEEPSQFQIAPFARLPVKFHQSHLNFRVTISLLLLAPAENFVNQVSKAGGDFEQSVVASHTMVSDSRLKEVTGAIKFVHVPQVRPALIFAFKGKESVQVAVSILSRFNF